MSIYKDIKDVRKEARLAKASTKATFLATVLGDIQRRAEKEGCKDNPTDEVVIAELQAYMKRYEKLSDEVGLTQEQTTEIIWVETHLPRAASEGEIKVVIKALDPQSMKDMGVVMKDLKDIFPVLDGALASQLVKEYIRG